MNSTQKNYKLALTGLFSALCIVLSITPLGYIKLGFINITIIHIPVILAAILGGLGPALVTGLIFGLTSCVRSNMMGTPFFGNPLCSVLPRVLFAASAWAIYTGLSKLPFIKKSISGAITAAVGTFLHTFYVMTMVFILFAQTLLGGMKIDAAGLKGYFIMLGTMYATNGIWEIIGAAIVTFAVLGAIYITANGKSKLSMEEEE
ncbi:MAG: ECF transporter S component [Treponema sp.]|nr:ECF transporter S component [Candidatus Treponema equifaecale]